jgi:hypothetical protein
MQTTRIFPSSKQPRWSPAVTRAAAYAELRPSLGAGPAAQGELDLDG